MQPKSGKFLIAFVMYGLLTVSRCHAQLIKNMFRVKTDTSFVSEHDDDLTVRPFLERNFNQYRLINTQSGRALNYQPNAPLQAGLGFSYRIIGVGFGVALPYVNKYNKYDKGRITDFSSHFYLRRLTIDAYYQYYGGQHLHNPEKVINDWNKDQLYLRNDITTKVLGVGFQYVLRPVPFSLEPLSFVHYQKRSAGSFIVGVHLTHTGISGDSSIIPARINNNIGEDFVLVQALAWNASVNGGYAYTQVFRKHYFVTAALSLGAGISVGELEGPFDNHIRGTGFLLNGTARLAAGYNSEYFFVGLQYIGYSGISQTPLPYLKQQYSIGKINFTVAKRIRLRRKLLGFY